METNNYVESWHNQLKTTHLKRKPNRRLDCLIFILINDIVPEFVNNINRLTLRIGRMGPKEREEIKRKGLAEEIPDEQIEEYVSKEYDESRNIIAIRVKSFDSTSSNVHKITIVNNMMTDCECKYFAFRKNACKHMNLCHRHNINIQAYQPPTQPLLLLEQSNENSRFEENRTEEQQRKQLNDIQVLLAAFAASNDKLNLLSNEDWEMFDNIKSRLNLLNSSHETLPLPNNSNLARQRRYKKS